MTVISLGAGVQSTTLLLLSAEGDRVPKADVAIFADTGWEPSSVYAHLGRLEQASSIPIVRVSAGNLRHDALNGKGRFASMPLFTRDEGGKVSMLRRQCTREYKVAPINREIRKRRNGEVVTMYIGISLDEAHRMKPSRVSYVHHEWPLVDLGWTRAKCREYLSDRGWTDVPKSSCIGCPFHDDHYWERMKYEHPDEFSDAVEFDERIRLMPRLRDKTYIHRSATPLKAAVFDLSEQPDLFGNECEGMCGV